MDAAVYKKAGSFICRLNLLRLPFDSFGAWKISSQHGDENGDVALHGKPTKVILNLLQNSIKRILRCLEVVEQDQTGLC